LANRKEGKVMFFVEGWDEWGVKIKKAI